MDIQEAKEAYKDLKKNAFIVESIDKNFFLKFAETILSELDKDNNIISDLKNEVTLKQCELDKKEKIINDMAEIIEECRQNDCLESNEIDLSEIAGKNRIIDYFTNKYEEGKGN